MDPRLLRHYERELRHLREMGSEFAREFPKVAGRLGLEGLECADPYVERLIESSAFLAARVQLKIDDEFPRFTQHMLELAYPHYLAPTPSMTVVQFTPSAREGSLAGGFTLPRETILRGRTGKRDQTACEYRTCHELELWPLEMRRAEYTTSLSELAGLRLPIARPAKAMLRLVLGTTSGGPLSGHALQRLPLFISGGDEIAMALYEQLLSSASLVIARPGERPAGCLEMLSAEQAVRPLGFDDADAMLPYGARSFRGYRLLHEYFAFPSRFMFVEFSGLGSIAQRCHGSELELLVLFEQEHPLLEGMVDQSRVRPFCTPAINLFPRHADRIHVSDRQSEYHIVPDRTRPLDLEVHSITKVVGYGVREEAGQEFYPLYRARDEEGRPTAYFTTSRQPRGNSAQQREHGRRSSYIGSEVFLSIAPGHAGAAPLDTRTLAVSTLCTNRDLPLHLPVGQGSTDFTTQSGAPVDAIRCVAGPSAPRVSHAHGDTAWRLMSHLSLNYLSLINEGASGASALREMLALYADLGDPAARKQVAGVRSVSTSSVVRPMPSPGPMCFGRGLEVSLECDETSFQGSGVFLLGSVLERFFAKYTSINSFTETVLRTLQRGEVMRWPTTSGQRHIL